MEAPHSQPFSHQQHQLHNNYTTSPLFAPAMTAAPLTPPTHALDLANPTLVKMEDISLSAPFAASPLPPTSDPATPPPSDGKPAAKKRKSWGQVLPEPKTNLPPRKRAKTEDEKEQRRIERVKRNRLAAHNSRERKRQEVEELQADKDRMEQQLQAAQSLVAKMSAQIKAFQQRHPEETFDLSFDSAFDASSPATDLDSVLGTSETVCPRQTSFPSPVSLDSMDSPRDDSCQPETPVYSGAALVSIDLGNTLFGASPSDAGLPHLVQPHPPVAHDKPLDDLFAFDSFPDHPVDTVGESDFFTSSFYDASAADPYGLST